MLAIFKRDDYAIFQSLRLDDAWDRDAFHLLRMAELQYGVCRLADIEANFAALDARIFKGTKYTSYSQGRG